MSKIKFEVGKFYRTRDGRKVKLIGDAREAETCIVFYPLVFMDMKCGSVFPVNDDGNRSRTSEGDLDIVGEWKEPVTRTGIFRFYLTPSGGGEFCVSDIPHPLLREIGYKDVEVTITEGDGING